MRRRDQGDSEIGQELSIFYQGDLPASWQLEHVRASSSNHLSMFDQ